MEGPDPDVRKFYDALATAFYLLVACAVFVLVLAVWRG